jgi:hypothetical protein
MGDQQGALGELQPLERAVEGIGVDDARQCRVVGPRVGGTRAAVQAKFPDTRTPTGCHPAGVRDDPSQPCVEPIGVAEAMQAAPRGDERLLRRVLRIWRVPQDRVGGPVHGIDLLADQHLEGVAITGAGALHE